MKRTLLIVLLIISMLAVVGFAPAGASYWDEMKEIYEWKAAEGESEAEFNLTVPSMDINYQYKVFVSSQSNLEDFSSYSEIRVEDVQGQLNIPTIKTYTQAGDIYLNKEAVLALLSAIGVADEVEIEEEFVMLENSQFDSDVDLNAMLNNIIEFVDKIDLGVDINIEKEGNTYTLELESDELIDLLDAYFRFSIGNIDQLLDILPQEQEVVITEEEKQEALDGYNAFVSQYKNLAKTFIKGSKFYMEGTFEEGKYSENTQLDIKVADMGELNVKASATSTRLESIDFELPTSVMKITTDELGELIASKIVGVTDAEVRVVIKLDGTYVKFSLTDLEDGQIPLEIIDDLAYMTVEDAEKLFGIKLEGLEDPFHVRKLGNYGFNVDWNEEARVIEIYR